MSTLHTYKFNRQGTRAKMLTFIIKYLIFIAVIDVITFTSRAKYPQVKFCVYNDFKLNTLVLP